ncbi:MAG: Crp/Fnr family transcriptional regulator [Devosia sp.]|nr:Crp/Fnr family transcriptional regulator [Devosia sp.]
MLWPATEVAAKIDLIGEGDCPSVSTLLVDGLVARYKVLENGSRQIVAVHVPGDFVDFNSFLIRPLDHGISTLTPCRISKVPHALLRDIGETHPHLMRVFTLMALIDGAISREWVVNLGRRDATKRAAHLFCEIYTLLEVVVCVSDHAFSFPVTQSDLADMMGLSQVHVNRTLQDLRQMQLIEWTGGPMTIPNWRAMVEFAGFDPTYLHLVNAPR